MGALNGSTYFHIRRGKVIPFLFADVSAMGDDLSPFITTYNQRRDKVIDQCSTNSHQFERIKEDFLKKLDEFEKETDAIKEHLANKTREFQGEENQLKAQLETIKGQLSVQEGITDDIRDRCYGTNKLYLLYVYLFTVKSRSKGYQGTNKFYLL